MARKARPHLKSVYHLSQRPHSCLPLHAISIAPSSLAIVIVHMPSLLHLMNISVTGTYNLIGRDAECASGFSVAHAHASLNTSSPSYASRPKSAICASVYRRYLYHQRSPPWCCHILTFAMTEKSLEPIAFWSALGGRRARPSPITMETSLINRVLPTYIPTQAVSITVSPPT